MTFAHLHVHTEYSLLDGFSNIKKLVKKTKEMGMPAVAITDHGTMFGVIEFYNAAHAAGVKPIIGLEAYLSPRRMQDKDSKLDKQASHLLLLAENDTGYKNLLQIASAAQLEGFYYHPRIDREFLQAHSEGLICTSGCMAAEVPRLIRDQGIEAARARMDWYYEVFGQDRFFIELQQHDIAELQTLNRSLLELGQRYQANYIATNDVHYINPDDWRLQDIMLAVQTGSLITDPNRFRMSDHTYYLRTPEEMAALFGDVPGALSNTLLIAERCNVDLSTKGYHLPLFNVAEGYTAESYLRELCEEGLKTLYGPRATDPEVRKRLEYELSVIHQMGFDTYFLIVWDLCRYARANNIWYNARGSAAGSMVAYTLDITLVEPINHGLIFERFLNPGRISMPDIDLDFQDDLRPRMMEYCAQRYGNDKVAQIITFGTLGARAAIRDVGRVMDIPISEVDRVAKTIPAVQGKSTSIAEVLENTPEMKALYNEAPYFKELIDTAAQVEGTIRNAGTHAAGVLITDEPIVNYTPLHRPTSGSEDSPIKSVSQFEMSIVESLGLLKVDFLGLATLTIMARACSLIKARHGVELNLHNIPTDDALSFEFIGKGHTAGVFQLEGTGMTRYIMQMKPKNLANIIAMVALYRPGPLDFIPNYIRRMHGEEEVTYRHPALEPIFCETYGIPIYQEQIMFAAMGLAGYTASEADDLRKAISKKKIDSLMKHRQKFIKGSQERGIIEETATAIFDDWENFARYGFNKSHAADYGVISIQTAYLKAHYTVEYMTALLSASKNESEKVALYVADAHSMGVDVLPPDVNHSGWDFTIEDREDGKSAIRFGLGAVKNVGQAPVELILKARVDGPFRDLTDFSRRVDLRQMGKRALEAMIKVGALDHLVSGEGSPRKALLESLDRILSVSSSHFRAAQSGQLSFFGGVAGVEEDIQLPMVMSLDRREELEWERELIGLYVSDHPLSPYLPLFKQRITHFSGQLSEASNKDKVIVAGMVTRFRNFQTKTNKSMGFVTLEDIQGNLELVLFPKTWERYGKLVGMDVVLMAEGRVDSENGDPKILVDKLEVVSMENLPSDLIDEPAAGASSSPYPDWPSDDQPPPPPPPDDWFMPEPPVDDAWGMAESLPPRGAPPAPKSEPPAPAVLKLEPAAPVVQKAQAAAVQPPAAVQIFPSSAPASQSLAETAPVFSAPAPPVIPDLPAESASAFVPFPFMPPGELREGEVPPRMLTVIFRSQGDKDRDVRRLRRAHGLLRSTPGKDHFSFLVFESGHSYLLDFPNDTTGITPDLKRQLTELVGEENVRVDFIQVH